MISTSELPSIDELHDLIDSVPRYPVSSAELTSLATREGAGRRVIDFYRAFPADQIFYDKDDLVSRSEAIEIMNEDEQPFEQLRSPQS